MTTFEVRGPYLVELEWGKNGTRFVSNNQPDLKEKCVSFKRRGCYIFARKSGRGEMPIYVGKTDRQTVIKKAFDPLNIKKIDKWLVQQRQKKLVIYTITQFGRGKTSASGIEQMETELIAFARARNKHLINKKKMAEPKWSIAGLIRARQGKPSAPAASIRKVLGM
jgi:hypothetical protein